MSGSPRYRISPYYCHTDNSCKWYAEKEIRCEEWHLQLGSVKNTKKEVEVWIEKQLKNKIRERKHLATPPRIYP